MRLLPSPLDVKWRVTSFSWKRKLLNYRVYCVPMFPSIAGMFLLKILPYKNDRCLPRRHWKSFYSTNYYCCPLLPKGNKEPNRHVFCILDSVWPKHYFVFRPKPKHRNVTAEPKQNSNVTILPNSECYIKHFTTHLFLHCSKMTIFW